MLKAPLLFLALFSPLSLAETAVIEIIPLNNRPASDLQGILTPLLERSERVIANSSSLIIKASPSRQKELKDLINQLDIRLSNLSISVIQTRIKTAEQLNNSLTFGFNSPLKNPAYFSGNINGRFAQTEGLRNTESRQEVRTLEGRPAIIKTGKIHPVRNINLYDSGYGHSSISSNIQFIEATSGFMVTPRLTGSFVTVDISPWSDRMNNKGSIDTQGGRTSVQVKLGEWVEIGSINDHSKSVNNAHYSHHYSTKNDAIRILIKVDKK